MVRFWDDIAIQGRINSAQAFQLMDRVSAYKKVELLKWLVQTKTTGNVATLAHKLEVSERTVYRLLDMLRELHQKEIIYSHLHISYIFADSSTENNSLPESDSAAR
jgi:predicted DNA-binding transcriptional regulator